MDETYIGGKERNRYWYKKHKSSRSPVGKTAAIGAKERKEGL